MAQQGEGDSRLVPRQGRPHPATGQSGQVLTLPDQVVAYLQGVNYPVRPVDIIRRAQEANADEEVITALGKLEDKLYSGPELVVRALRQVL